MMAMNKSGKVNDSVSLYNMNKTASIIIFIFKPSYVIACKEHFNINQYSSSAVIRSETSGIQLYGHLRLHYVME